MSVRGPDARDRYAALDRALGFHDLACGELDPSRPDEPPDSYERAAAVLLVALSPTPDPMPEELFLRIESQAGALWGPGD